MTSSLRYVPILLARRGELDALRNLSTSARPGMLPLLVAPPASQDTAQKQTEKTLGTRLEDLAEAISSRWTGPAFIDLRYLQDEQGPDGAHPLKVFVDGLVRSGVSPVPVTSPGRPGLYDSAVTVLHRRHELGVCLRLPPEQWPSDDKGAGLKEFLGVLKVPVSETDLILDLGTRIQGHPTDTAEILEAELFNLPFARSWRSVTVAGTAFPATMGGRAEGLSSIERTEWVAYRQLLARLPPDLKPSFGDYAIANPAADMGAFPPGGRISATLRYTNGDQWIIAKGGLYAGKPRGMGAAAMNPVAAQLSASTYFAGRQHCRADAWIAAVADDDATGGSPTTWRQHGTLHHLTLVSEQIATLFAS
ncbi:beta family protein [Parafrankia sp. EUN1f]|uniref:beta family protein n=1 Tax=Parafrankia sp. EUN1f TaxID=102897 RepID=UPI0001C43B00|nr:beta family protein [Parafrankia sp. EUN1f]EFC82583.1 conserved hypothetical protein [Parafrankia sp. EUN1f]